MSFDENFENEILAKTLKDVSFLQQASRILDSHHFSTPQHSWIWEIIKSSWYKYREQPTRLLIITKIKDEFKKPEDRIAYLELTKKLFKKKPTAAKSTLDELHKFVRGVSAQQAMENAAESLEKGEIDKTYEHLNRLVRKDNKVGNYSLIHWMEEFEERQYDRLYKKNHPNEKARIPTGIKKIDKIMLGGIEVGEMGLVIGTTNMGKSALLTGFAHNAIRNKFRCLYVALEMKAIQIATRNDARWLGIETNKIKTYNFLPSELRHIKTKHKKASKIWKNMFKIVSMPVKYCNINILKGVLDDLWHLHNFRPQVIMMDSGDHMRGVGRFESVRLEQASIYQDLKSLAEDDGYAIWSTVHAGREWVDKIATAESASESYDKSRLADVVLSINNPAKTSRSTKVMLEDDDGEENDLSSKAEYRYGELFMSKYREGASRVNIPIDADFAKMLIKEIE